MRVIFDHITVSRLLAMRNGSRWDPAPGESDTVITWQSGAAMNIRGPLSPSGYNYQIQNLDTGESILAKRDE